MKKETKQFDRPMFNWNGFLYPIPDSISIKWIGYCDKKGNMYHADTIKEGAALNSLMSGAKVHDGLNDMTWDKIEIYAASILPGGFGFEIVNYEKMCANDEKREIEQ
jgi:hypothetical protein